MAITRLFQRAVLAAGIAGLAIAAGTPSASAGPAAPADTSKIPGITKPSEENNLAFPGPGVVSTVAIEAGSTVKAGMVLATQDMAEENAKLDVSKLQADSVKEIEAAEADLAAKQVDLKRKEELYAAKIAKHETNSELDEARVAVQIDVIAVEFRKESKKQKELELKLQQVKVDQKKLISPIDGVVTEVDIHPGEGVDLTKPAVQVVQINPLWVEVQIPTAQTKTLKKGDKLMVTYNGEKTPIEARIIFLTSYADAGSNTRHVRLLMSNPELRAAGQQVTVQLPANETASAK